MVPEQTDEKSVQESLIVKTLLKHRTTAQGSRAITELAESLKRNVATARKYLASTAEQLARAQVNILKSCCEYAQSLAAVGSLQVLAFLEIQAYDECSLRLRVAQGVCCSDPVGHNEPEFLVLRGLMSPAVRACNSASARSTAVALARCPRETHTNVDPFKCRQSVIQQHSF